MHLGAAALLQIQPSRSTSLTKEKLDVSHMIVRAAPHCCGLLPDINGLPVPAISLQLTQCLAL
jgi:hypothetical protein